jgi:hypothetical protein
MVENDVLFVTSTVQSLLSSGKWKDIACGTWVYRRGTLDGHVYTWSGPVPHS